MAIHSPVVIFPMIHNVLSLLYKKTRRVPPTFKKPHIYMARAAVLLRTSTVTR